MGPNPMGSNLLLHTNILYTNQNKLANDKRSGLFFSSVSHKEKSFTTWTPKTNVIKLFFNLTHEEEKKLECLSPASLTSLVWYLCSKSKPTRGGWLLA